MSDSLLTILEMMEEVLSEAKNQGVLFEEVIVDIAKKGFNASNHNDKNTSAKSASGRTLGQLAVEALKQMGFAEENIMNGPVDPTAIMHTKRSKIKGEAKTDVVIRDKKISLKLPGPIQLASGETRWTEQALNAAFDELLETQEGIIENKMLQDIRATMNTARRLLQDSSGRFYIADNYEQALRNKYQARGLSPDKIEKEVDRGLKKVTNTPHADWTQWNEEVKSELNEALVRLFNSKMYTPFIVDEFLTGRRMFAATPEDIAEYLLSPSGFYSVKTFGDTKALLNESFLQNVRAQARGKGRPYMTKAVAIRIDFNQNAYVKAAKQAALQSLACDEKAPKVDPEPVLKCSVQPEKLLSDFVEQEVDLSSKTMEET